jgi:predicted O-methyltransferase YrrM
VSDERNPVGNAGLVFTNNWFNNTAKRIWDVLIPQLNPRKILEIGSYEGASACYLIAHCASKAPIEIHCIDTWTGGIEHTESGVDMTEVERRFLHNVKRSCEQVPYHVDLTPHKGYSNVCLSELMASKKFSNYFDLIYIDGSHQAPDVLSDTILSFPLLKLRGFMIFDDYLWLGRPLPDRDLLRCPKPAIDAFLNIYFRKMSVVAGCPNSQVCAIKITD